MNSENLPETTWSPARPTQAEIATRAHEIWLAEGCPAGRHEDHWHEAERQLTSGLAQRSEQMDRGDNTRVVGSTSPHAALAERAPLATKVQEQLLDAGRPESRNSPTSLEL